MELRSLVGCGQVWPKPSLANTKFGHTNLAGVCYLGQLPLRPAATWTNVTRANATWANWGQSSLGPGYLGDIFLFCNYNNCYNYTN